MSSVLRRRAKIRSGLAPLLAAACAVPPAIPTPPRADATRPSPAPSSTTTLEVLDGALLVDRPARSAVEPNVSESIMGTADASSMRTEVHWRGVGYDVMAVFYRDLLPCQADPAAAAAALADSWSEVDGPHRLEPRPDAALPTFVYFPQTVPERDGVSAPMSAIVCTGDAGLVDMSVLVRGDPARAHDEVLALTDSIRPGPRPADLSARAVPMPSPCGEPLATLEVPEGYFHAVEVGADFEIVRLTNILSAAEGAWLALYTGHHPRRFAPPDAESVTDTDAEGRELSRRQWHSDDGRVHFETYDVPRIPCARHVWAEAADPTTLQGLWHAVR